MIEKAGVRSFAVRCSCPWCDAARRASWGGTAIRDRDGVVPESFVQPLDDDELAALDGDG